MPGEFAVGEGVVGVDQLGGGAVGADEVVEELDRLAVHRDAEALRESREAGGVGLGDFAEFFEAEPLAGEVAGERFGAPVDDHPLGLGAQGGGVGELAFVGELQQAAVGHRGPEEVGETGGEFEVVDLPLGLAGLVGLDPEEEGRVDQQRLEGGAKGFFVGGAGGELLAEEGEQRREVLVGDAAAEGERGVGEQDAARGFFRGQLVAGLGDDDPGEVLRVVVDRVDDFLRGREVFLHQRRLDEHRVADVVEAFATGAVGGEIAAGQEIDAEEVADGVVVFVAVEPADGGAAGVAGKVAGLELFEDGADLIDELLAFGIGRQHVLVVGRHVAVLDLFRDVFEEAVVAQGGVGGGQRMHLDPALLGFFAVAFVAVFRKQRRHLVREVIRPAGEGQGEQQGDGAGKDHAGRAETWRMGPGFQARDGDCRGSRAP